ncbi:MAG: c-type cytochrome [Acidimicrobiales bacterium]
MTEVPEHLLKRSRDRRAALGLGGGDGGDAGGAGGAAPAAAADAGSSVEPAAAARPAAVAPVEAEVAPPKPVPSYVRASLNRKKIPLWVMPVLAFLPLWAVMYVNTLSKPRTTVPTQLEAGATAYANRCQSCHQADGSGGAGRPLYAAADGGGVITTFPYIADQLQFVWLGSVGTGAAGTEHGNPDKPGGAHKTLSYNGNPMPTFKGTVTQAELLEIVRHERETFGGEKVPAKQIAADGSLLWPNGKPVLNTSGVLVDPDGNPMFDDTGHLINKTLLESADASTSAPAS